jgi:hypothetical protein
LVHIKANYKLTGWNANQLKTRVGTILTAYSQRLGDQFKEEIKSPQFPWPGLTRRKNGTVVGSPRDIVDTGAFLASQRRERPDSSTILFSWGNDGVNYAGKILRGTGPTYPSRDWIRLALDKQPLEQFFAVEWRRLARRKL